MAAISTKLGRAGKGLGGGTGREKLATVGRDIADDLIALRAAFVALTAKLDADATLAATDFAATCDPPALKTSKA